MYFLGIDQSLTSSGIAVLDGALHKPVYLTTISTGKLRDAERLDFIEKDLAFVTTKYAIKYAALEGYSFESVHRALDLGELGGILRLHLYRSKIPFLVVPPTTLKKFVAHNGGATKEHMMKAVAQKWQQRIEQDDMCDAYGLAQVARAYALNITSSRAELEMLRSLDPKQPGPVIQGKGRTKVSV